MQKILLIRIPEHNDWVVFILFGSVAAFVLMLLYLHREASLKDFLTQEIADSGNIFPTWILVSVVNALLLSTLLSQYLPAVPRAVNNFSVFEISLNKFGYTFLAVSGFYVIKTIFSYLFYSSVGQGKKWNRFWFVASRFYFVFSIVMMVAVFVNYFYPIDREVFFHYLIIALMVILVFKTVFYLLNRNRILPAEWYYKILYICTLQIVPVIGLWRLLFF